MRVFFFFREGPGSYEKTEDRIRGPGLGCIFLHTCIFSFSCFMKAFLTTGFWALVQPGFVFLFC